MTVLPFDSTLSTTSTNVEVDQPNLQISTQERQKILLHILSEGTCTVVVVCIYLRYIQILHYSSIVLLSTTVAVRGLLMTRDIYI